MLSVRKPASASMLVLVLALLAACGGPSSPAPGATTGAVVPPPAQATAQATPGGTLVVSMGVNVADTLNQHQSINTGSRMVAHHVLDTLVIVNPADGSVNPSLATSWDVSADGKVYTFKLRQGVKFQDGTPFNAQAVKFNFDYTVRPDIKHAFAWAALNGDKYDHSEVVDDYTLKVFFKSPHPTFLINLSDGGLGIDSPAAMQAAGDDYGVKSLVGTGPFKFKEWVKNDHITLVRNDDYIWAPAIYKHKGPPLLDQLTYRDVSDIATRAAALESGDLQEATLVESQVAQFKTNKDVQLILTPKAGTVRMYMMNNVKTPTDDLKVRQAINYAIDKAALIQLPAWSGIGKPALSPLPSSMLPPEVLANLQPYGYTYDPEKAKQLLDDVGWKVGADGIRVKNGQPLVLIALAIAPQEVPQMEPIDQMLRKVGAKLNIQTGDFNWQVATRSKGDFNIALTSDSGYDSLRLINYFFSTKSPSNVYGFKAADAAIDKAANALSPKEMWDNLTQAQAAVLKEAAGVMGWEQMYVYGTRATVHDVQINEVGYPFFYDTWIEGKSK